MLDKAESLTEKLLKKEEKSIEEEAKHLLEVSLQLKPTKEDLEKANKTVNCSFCNVELLTLWYRCVNETCKEIRVCANCKNTKSLAHTLVDFDKEIHLGKTCAGCKASKKAPAAPDVKGDAKNKDEKKEGKKDDKKEEKKDEKKDEKKEDKKAEKKDDKKDSKQEEKKEEDPPIIGVRYNCLHVECKLDGKDYCENCFKVKEHVSGHNLVELPRDPKKKVYVCNFGKAMEDPDQFKCGKNITGKIFICKHPECSMKQDTFYCEGCKNKGHVEKHEMVDVKKLEECYACNNQMKQKYICIQCDDYRFCEECGPIYRCYEEHNMLPIELYTEIMNSDFANRCKNDHNFLKQLFMDVIQQDRKEKLKYCKDNNKKPKTVGIRDYQGDDNADEKERKRQFHRLGHKLVIREIMFVISSEYFAKVHRFITPGSDMFKDLFRLRLKCAMIKIPPTKTKWTCWDFSESCTLRKYETEHMDITVEVGLRHHIDEKFRYRMFAPTFLCDIYKKLGDFVDHVHGHIIIQNGNQTQKEEIHCKSKEKCDYCDATHWRIPLKVHPGECREENDSSEDSDSSIQEENVDNSDTSEEPEDENAEEADNNDAGDQNAEEEKDQANTQPKTKINRSEPNNPGKLLEEGDDDDNDENQDQNQDAGAGDDAGDGAEEGGDDAGQEEPEPEPPKDVIEFFLLGNKTLHIDKDSKIRLELKFSYHPSVLQETQYELHFPKKPEKHSVGIGHFIGFLNIPRNLMLHWEIFLMRSLWILVFTGMIKLFTIPVDLFVLITYSGYPYAENIFLKEKSEEAGSTKNIAKNGLVLLLLIGLMVVFWIISGNFSDAYGYMVIFALLAELILLGICSTTLNYKGIKVLEGVNDAAKKFYTELDTATAVQASSECATVKEERKEVMTDLMTLEMASSAGILINTIVFGTASFINVPWIKQFLADDTCGMVQLFNGHGFDIVMSMLLVEGLVFLGLKIAISYFVTQQTDHLANHIDHACDILEYVEKLPEPIIQTSEFLRSEITNETVLDLNFVTFDCEKMGVKYSKEDTKTTTILILNALLHQIQRQNKNSLFKFEEIKKKIGEASHMSQIRIKIVKTEIMDLIAEVEYKFLGKYKIDKEFIKKIYATVGAVLGTSGLAILKSVTGGSGGNSEGGESG